MADISEPSNTPHDEEEEEREITDNQAQAEPIPIDNDVPEFISESDEEDEDFEDDDLLMSDEVEEAEDSYGEEDDDDEDEDEEEEEHMDSTVISPRVPANSVEVVVVGEPNGCGEGGNVAAAAAANEGGEIDGLICPICMGPWTSGGDHQVCCLSCGHIYGLSCIRRWMEHCQGSAKCPQCNRKCKPKDVRVLYASRVVVADEESKEKIQFLEAKCAMLEETVQKNYDDVIQQHAAEIKRIVEQRYEELSQQFIEMKCIENQRYDDGRRQIEQQQQLHHDQFIQFMQQQHLQQQQQQLQQQQAEFLQQQHEAGISSLP